MWKARSVAAQASFDEKTKALEHFRSVSQMEDKTDLQHCTQQAGLIGGWLQQVSRMVEGSLTQLGSGKTASIMATLKKCGDDVKRLLAATEAAASARVKELSVVDDALKASCDLINCLRNRAEVAEQEYKKISTLSEKQETVMAKARTYVKVVIAERLAWQEMHGANAARLPLVTSTFVERCHQTMKLLQEARECHQLPSVGSLESASSAAERFQHRASDSLNQGSVLLRYVPPKEEIELLDQALRTSGSDVALHKELAERERRLERAKDEVYTQCVAASQSIEGVRHGLASMKEALQKLKADDVVNQLVARIVNAVALASGASANGAMFAPLATASAPVPLQLDATLAHSPSISGGASLKRRDTARLKSVTSLQGPIPRTMTDAHITGGTTSAGGQAPSPKSRSSRLFSTTVHAVLVANRSPSTSGKRQSSNSGGLSGSVNGSAEVSFLSASGSSLPLNSLSSGSVGFSAEMVTSDNSIRGSAADGPRGSGATPLAGAKSFATERRSTTGDSAAPSSSSAGADLSESWRSPMPADLEACSSQEVTPSADSRPLGSPTRESRARSVFVVDPLHVEQRMRSSASEPMITMMPDRSSGSVSSGSSRQNSSIAFLPTSKERSGSQPFSSSMTQPSDGSDSAAVCRTPSVTVAFNDAAGASTSSNSIIVQPRLSGQRSSSGGFFTGNAALMSSPHAVSSSPPAAQRASRGSRVKFEGSVLMNPPLPAGQTTSPLSLPLEEHYSALSTAAVNEEEWTPLSSANPEARLLDRQQGHEAQHISRAAREDSSRRSSGSINAAAPRQGARQLSAASAALTAVSKTARSGSLMPSWDADTPQEDDIDEKTRRALGYRRSVPHNIELVFDGMDAPAMAVDMSRHGVTRQLRRQSEIDRRLVHALALSERLEKNSSVLEFAVAQHHQELAAHEQREALHDKHHNFSQKVSQDRVGSAGLGTALNRAAAAAGTVVLRGTTDAEVSEGRTQTQQRTREEVLHFQQQKNWNAAVAPNRKQIQQILRVSGLENDGGALANGGEPSALPAVVPPLCPCRPDSQRSSRGRGNNDDRRVVPQRAGSAR